MPEESEEAVRRIHVELMAARREAETMRRSLEEREVVARQNAGVLQGKIENLVVENERLRKRQGKDTSERERECQTCLQLARKAAEL
jgi:hypothetical protein